MRLSAAGGKDSPDERLQSQSGAPDPSDPKGAKVCRMCAEKEKQLRPGRLITQCRARTMSWFSDCGSEFLTRVRRLWTLGKNESSWGRSHAGVAPANPNRRKRAVALGGPTVRRASGWTPPASGLPMRQYFVVSAASKNLLSRGGKRYGVTAAAWLLPVACCWPGPGRRCRSGSESGIWPCWTPPARNRWPARRSVPKPRSPAAW